MSVKLRGADYKAFMHDESVWLHDYWFEGCGYKIDGVEVEDDDFSEDDIPDEAQVVVTGGCLYQGGEVNSPFVDYERTLRAWLKARKVTTVVLEIANEHLDAYRATLGALPGVKILR